MERIPEPRVTMIIPCYNQSRFLAEAIDSALSQTYSPVEVIVVDDGSTDQTPEVAARYRDRIRYVRKANAGLSAARNTGILEARGEFLLFLDADDTLWPDMLERHMEAARVQPTGACFLGAWQWVDLSGRILVEKTTRPIGGDPFHTLLAGFTCPCHCMLVRRSALADAGIFDVHLRSCEDRDLWIRLAAAGYEFVSVPDAVAVYRRYPGSMSMDSERMWRSGLAVLQKSSRYHRNCALCRKALARGRWQLHGRRFFRLREELALLWETGQTWTALLKALRSTVQAPAMMIWLWREMLKPFYRRLCRLSQKVARARAAIP